jgi:hypothetical protein
VWECLLHLFQVFLVRKEGLEERITLDHGIPIRPAAPKKVKFELVLIKYNPVIGGVRKDEFLLLWSGGQMMFSSKEKEGSCRQGEKSVFRAKFIPGRAFDVVDYS